MTHASRDTSTGLQFEKQVHVGGKGIDLSQDKMRKYIEKLYPNVLYSLSHINQYKRDKKLYADGAPYILTKELKPDEAYYDPEKLTLDIYEKKVQNGGGSADEKIQTCAFKIMEYRKVAKYLNVPPENVHYTYVLDEWFDPEKNIRYRDALEFVKSIDGCDYIIVR